MNSWPKLVATPSERSEHATLLVHPMRLSSGRVMMQLEMSSMGDEGPDDERNAQIEMNCDKLDELIATLQAARAQMKSWKFDGGRAMS